MDRPRLLPARTSPHDREIWRLALPAFGALAAEPLYVLVDTAIVGRLGTRPLAGLAVAGAVLTAAFALFNFLAYSTTAAVARRLGAGDRRVAAELGVDGAWLGLGLGVALMLIGLLASSWIVDAMGASANIAPFALEYLRISLLGAPALLVALAGTGYLRGMQDTRTTLYIAVGAALLNLALEIVFVYGFDWGIAGSAWGTVIAQLAAASAFVAIVVRSVRRESASLRPSRSGIRQTAVVGGPLIVRTASLLVVFLATTNLAARISDDAVAANQIVFGIFLFLALSRSRARQWSGARSAAPTPTRHGPRRVA
jgi:putative MATE family efflux protein